MQRGSRAPILYILLACSVAFSGVALSVKPITGLRSGAGGEGTHTALDTSLTRVFHSALANRTAQLKLSGCLGIIIHTITRTSQISNGLNLGSIGYGGCSAPDTDIAVGAPEHTITRFSLPMIFH